VHRNVFRCFYGDSSGEIALFPDALCSITNAEGRGGEIADGQGLDQDQFESANGRANNYLVAVTIPHPNSLTLRPYIISHYYIASYSTKII